MRSRSNSGVRLDYFQRLVNKTILKHQNAVTGLLPATPDHPHAWVRDNLYSCMCVWGLALAYRKNADLDEDRAKAYELEQSVVKLMRGLLMCMMKQVGKLETFKHTQLPSDALHAKYSVKLACSVVGDNEWGHLQIDATSLYLLMLGQMTASGLQIIFTLDEVTFIQNMVFYIEAAYRIPDYGIWERGDKTNHGLPELNGSSIGMAKAALEAVNELDLFGARGGPESVIHVLADEPQQCQAVLQSMLPRESNSKEVDSALLSIISFPAFAVEDEALISVTRDTIIDKLQGRYGCSRFLRDGYKTAKEDPSRLYYEPWELKVFENIECEWPVFFAYLILDGIFMDKPAQVEEYKELLDSLLIKDETGLALMPELYAVSADKVDQEYKNPKSQDRSAIGKMPHMWGQSLYVLGRLLIEGFLSPGELDPLNRRLVTEPKPDLVVQVVILAEDHGIQEMLAAHGLHVQTFSQVAPINVYPARVLSYLYSHLGKNEKLGLSGRLSNEIGLLSTSKLYMVGDQVYAFLPQFVDHKQFYLAMDSAMIVEIFKVEVAYVASSWSVLGRPTIIFPVMGSLLVSNSATPWLRRRYTADHSQSLPLALVATIQKLQSGYINGTRVQLGNLIEFLSTSCVTKLTFLPQQGSEDDPLSPSDYKISQFISSVAPAYTRSRLPSNMPKGSGSRESLYRLQRRQSIHGIVKRTKSIAIDTDEDFDSEKSDSVRSFGNLLSPGGSSGPPSPGGMLTVEINCVRKLSSASISQSLENEQEFAVHYLKGSLSPSQMQGQTSPITRRRNDTTDGSDPHYEGVDASDLIEMLKETENLQEQADIIYYLYIAKGPDWDTGLGGYQDCTVTDLMKELYERAGHLKQWWLVRHTAGLLRKRVEDLAKAVTDLLVRQKQLAVGLPPEPREQIITRPLPPDELAAIIHNACGDDCSTAMFTQELLVYLAMFIRTEPNLFAEMLRLRVGLIIQVMAVELARTLQCSGEEASDHLLNLSPYETKTLLHHILSGKEFGVNSASISTPGSRTLSITEIRRKSQTGSLGKSLKEELKKTINPPQPIHPPTASHSASPEKLEEALKADRHGQWLRRRRLDGALNRVPVGFYPRVWDLLERCHGLSIESHILQQSLTREMTQGELKFALQVEMVLNKIPQPEYRQLNVEAMMVLTMLVENDSGRVNLNYVIHLDKLVWEANLLFLKEQVRFKGDAMTCCAKLLTTGSAPRRSSHSSCGGSAGICQHFYDSAPSGRYGTMTYLFRAIAQHLHFPVQDGDSLDCVLS
ncbi:phosphorylase b kinase regulatory subunit alpha, liver isoform-like isoform X3 [Lineus longissimus]|uniref:phosphorylase b kinase regulatory subunit alpha, liver isoform-like isoform X3 n=1 Tax=Lineus longissimus TaxID=88925 RepID=UPI00315D451C